MKVLGRYDSDMQMFVEGPRELDLRRLMFLRWLTEQERLEHPAVGPSTGELTVRGAIRESHELTRAS